MATLDKHPPLDPNRHSTNKRVMAKMDPYFGVRHVTADGSKRVRPGDTASTSAKKVGASETTSQRHAREAREATEARQREIDRQIWEQENRKQGARTELLERGWMSQNEVLTLQRSYRKKML